MILYDNNHFQKSCDPSWYYAFLLFSFLPLSSSFNYYILTSSFHEYCKQIRFKYIFLTFPFHFLWHILKMNRKKKNFLSRKKKGTIFHSFEIFLWHISTIEKESKGCRDQLANIRFWFTWSLERGYVAVFAVREQWQNVQSNGTVGLWRNRNSSRDQIGRELCLVPLLRAGRWVVVERWVHLRMEIG